MPNTIKEYIHVIGRASRMGDQGSAILFVNEESKHLFPDLVVALKSCGAAIIGLIFKFFCFKFKIT